MSFSSKKLLYFIKVMEEGSIAKAADKLFITPSPLSKKIRELEEELGVDLFYRVNGKIIPSMEGYKLYHKVVDLHYSLDKVMAMHNKKHRINVIVYGALFPYIEEIMLRVSERLKGNYSINFMATECENKLNEVICFSDIIFSLKRINSKGNALEISNELSPAILSSKECDDIKSLNFIQCSFFSSTEFFMRVYNKLRKSGFNGEVVCVDSNYIRAGLVKSGRGITIIPDINWPDFEICNGIEYHQLHVKDEKFYSYLYVNNNLLLNKFNLKEIITELSGKYSKHNV
ncbi:LysR family transcriptional regulator [Enterobacter hormaechei]|uniref:LysR family transcriptional regulator n=1 Tax=Enterobacter hormaechei TaxID=158836 RepID=UPI00254BE430|nr:LysR family transcriptional regulator [Enterobacter hormaechei]MDK9637833.1 LysR family transcriptional regulator [Enterobacter hormaechei]